MIRFVLLDNLKIERIKKWYSEASIYSAGFDELPEVWV